MTIRSIPVEITPEPEGGYSVECLAFPGAVSQGETIDEATANIREAVEGSIAGYRDAGEPIPWYTQQPQQTPIIKHLAIEVGE